MRFCVLTAIIAQISALTEQPLSLFEKGANLAPGWKIFPQKNGHRGSPVNLPPPKQREGLANRHRSP